MRFPALLLAVAAALAACDRGAPAHDTSVLGARGPAQAPGGVASPLTDARGRAIPAPPAPATARVQAVRSGEEAALALWLQDGRVMASSWTRDGGWTPARALEEIYGQASDPQLASNGQGQAMAVWRHTVGKIESLRFSHHGQDGWTAPDVMPGALPRPDDRTGTRDAPRLRMDAQGDVVAEWASGFQANESQTARWTGSEGWSRAASEPAAPAPSASPALPAPSSAR
ncbi:MAG TPA: hypothetical protein VF522_11855 [Ramlibacter sp.]|uniref:hypothetical protein n=1 Tax=Ramlibacter sp. TaxID=1917967 RepID=UPI002ED1BD9D